jgi:hypothetical protein
VAIDIAIERLDNKSQAQEDGMTTLNDQLRCNGEKLRQIESTIGETLNDLAQRLASTQTVVRDIEHNVVTRITMVDESIASGHLVTQTKLEELTRKIEQLSAASELVSRPEVIGFSESLLTTFWLKDNEDGSGSCATTSTPQS